MALPRPNFGRNSFITVTVLTAFIVGLFLRWDPSFETTTTRKDDIRYGIIFDAGSTGTRVHVYRVLHNLSSSEQPFVLLNYELYECEPGVSAFAKFPREVAKNLRPLLVNASLHVPRSHWSKTMLLLRATAGLRLLPDHVANSILAEIYSLFKEYTFKMPSEESVGIMDGVDEGIFAWMTLNFVKGALFNRKLTSTIDKVGYSNTFSAILDFGGGSAQLTFLPGTEETLLSSPKGYLHDLLVKYPNMGKFASKVYAYSYLGLGLMSARRAMLKQSKNASSTKSDQIFESPCFPENFSTEWLHCGKSWRVCSNIRSSSMQLSSVPNESDDEINFSKCYESAVSILKRSYTTSSSEQTHRSFVHRPNELPDHEIFAVSFIVSRAVEAGLIDKTTGGVVSVEQFLKAAKHYCVSPSIENPFMCMDLTYITVLLHEGFGLPYEKQINVYKKINSVEISWPLGLFFDLLLRGF